MSVRLSVCQSVCLSVCLSVSQSVSLSICLSVYLSICLSVYLSVRLSVCLSVSIDPWMRKIKKESTRSYIMTKNVCVQKEMNLGMNKSTKGPTKISDR